MTYSDRLNVWHLELAIAQQASAKLFSELADFDDDLASIGHVLGLRLLALVESCPFPLAALKAAPVGSDSIGTTAKIDLDLQPVLASVGWLHWAFHGEKRGL
jgi:hypothetical protein